MDEQHTTAVVQRYLNELAGDAPAETAIRALLDRAVRRLHELCAALLHRSYPRLTRPPLNLQADELLGAVVERLLKALRAVRPGTVRLTVHPPISTVIVATDDLSTLAERVRTIVMSRCVQT